MLKIIIPMAGLGSRFAKVGYKEPKPLIPVFSYPMIKWVIANLTPSCPHEFIFICQRQHLIDYQLDKLLVTWAPCSRIIAVDQVTEGALCTVLFAKECLDNDYPLMIANSDQYVDININDYLNHFFRSDLDGLIMTMPSDHPKWSFVQCDQNGFVLRVEEKQVISDQATVGIYNFRSSQAFLKAAESMIKKNIRVNNEFYVAPVYNELVMLEKKIKCYHIPADCMHGLGTPEDLSKFLNQKIVVQ